MYEKMAMLLMSLYKGGGVLRKRALVFKALYVFMFRGKDVADESAGHNKEVVK
jgi:hypothetical protein